MHVSVLSKEVIEYLNPMRNQNFIDCTLGAGGHTKDILELTQPNGKVLGIDWDKDALSRVKQDQRKAVQQKRLILKNANFAHLADIVSEETFSPVRGIVFDLGLSSDQLEQSGRGFSFRKSEPLDMRFSEDNQTTAAKIVNFQSKYDLERIFKEYGEEKFASKIASAIVEARKENEIKTTNQLVAIIENSVPGWYRRQRLHVATKTFQALRIAVNGELENIKTALTQAVDILPEEGRIVVISFHSLEDRIVKQFFAEHQNLELLTKKPLLPSASEIKENPRARSAKLRAAKKISSKESVS